jgi:hypothetical protein
VPRHVVRQCVAFGNRAQGFYANHHPGGLDFFNNIAFRNGTNYNMLTDTTSNHKLRNNIAMSPGTAISQLSGGTDTFNSWTLQVTVSAEDFLSMAEEEALAPRQPDGSLPATGFLRLAMNSDLIDKGEDVGLPFAGSAPDLGPFESGLASEPGGAGGGGAGTGGRAAGGAAGGLAGSGTGGTTGGVTGMGGASGGRAGANPGSGGGGRPGLPVGGASPSGGGGSAGTPASGGSTVTSTGGTGPGGRANGGTAPVGGSSGSPASQTAESEEAGCGCRIGAVGGTVKPWLALLAALAGVLAARRRTRT